MQGQPQDVVYDCSTLSYVCRTTAKYGASLDESGNLVDPGVCWLCARADVCWLYTLIVCWLAVHPDCMYDDRLCASAAVYADCVSFVLCAAVVLCAAGCAMSD